MRLLSHVAPVTILVFTVHTAAAQSDTHWEKTYAVSGQPTVFLTAGDSSLTITSCGACQTVKVRVEAVNHKLSDYRLEEDQNGNTIRFSLRDKPHVGLHFGVDWHSHSSVSVQVETPANLTLNATTSDGDLKASGLNGAISLRSSDGRQSIADVSGTLRVDSSDGDADLHNIGGSLDAHSSDGSLHISGKLDRLNVGTSDGKVDLELSSGSTLKADSMLHSSDGTVTVRLPKELSANLDVSTSDGKIDCNLPLTLDGFHSSGSSGHSVKGKLNAGGALLAIHTSDGTVHLSAM